jgi:hypothetical protein
VRIGLYIFSSIVFLIIVLVLAFLANASFYNLQVFGIGLSLPVALWITLPAFILLILSVLHMAYYSAKNFFVLRRWQKDSETLEDLSYWSILNEPRENHIITENLKNIASLLSNSSIVVKEDFESSNERIQDVINVVKLINGGTYVDLKSKKISKQLSNANPLAIRNCINRLQSDAKFAMDVLANEKEYDSSVVAEAINIVTKTQNMQTIKKYLPLMNVANLENIFTRLNSGDKVGINEENIKEIVNSITLSCKDYINLASSVMKFLDPKTVLSLFKNFEQKDENAEMAYLYLLLEYEMMDNAKEFINSNPENNFKKLKIFFDLKQKQNNLKLQDIVSLDSLCEDA